MINYFKDLFTKPKYLWTTLDDWAVIGLIFGLVIIIGIIWVVIVLIDDKLMRRKYLKCKNNLEFNWCYTRRHCRGCKHFKKNKTLKLKKKKLKKNKIFSEVYKSIANGEFEKGDVER